MGKGELTQEERFLKEGDRSAGILPVDVHDTVMRKLGLAGTLYAEGEEIALQTLPPREGAPKVMRRLETEAATGRGRKRFMGIPAKGWVAAAMVLVMLGGGYTQFSGKVGQGAAAKVQYKVLPYKPIPATNSGGMIEKAKLPVVRNYPSKVEPLSKEDEMFGLKYQKGINTLEKLLPPGEYATFVIERKDGKGLPGHGLYWPPMMLKEYSVYKTSVEKYKAPGLNKPEYLPNGYTLEQAVISPFFIKVDDILQATGLSKIDLGDNYQMRWRKEKPENITYESSMLVYKKDKIQLGISAERVDEKVKPLKSLMWTKTTKVENIEIDGKQLIYLETSANEKIDLGFKNRLVWADPEAKIIYNLSVAQEKSELSKDEIIRIAASMMK